MRRGNVRGHRCNLPSINSPHAKVWSVDGCVQGDLWECEVCHRLWIVTSGWQWRRVLFSAHALRRAAKGRADR